MAKTRDLPDWRQKQQVLYEGKATRDQRLEIARRLLEREMESEAVDYLEMERDEDLLRKILERAADRGDAFLYRRAAAALGWTPAAADWERVAARAEALGKGSFARMARAAAGGTAAPAAAGGGKGQAG